GMSDASYLISDGINLTQHYLNRPGYQQSLEGLAFSLTFLVAGILMVLVIILPGPQTAQEGGAMVPPQPRRRLSAEEELSAGVAEGEGREGAADRSGAQTIEFAEGEEGPAPVPAKEEKEEVKPRRRTEREAANAEGREGGGADDVVYGSEPVTIDSAWEYVQNYPDSAVKFLYRKTLDNKPLPPSDEEIYRRWERRGLSRALVREIVLDIMDWESLPDEYPHNVWRALRDQIYEMQAH
ncbi:MAG: hypothetical protein OEZ59_04630, partial [Deltaproteobacteria bacterium]|nr:hypothetical protein [Deltaproteobacteria bacterium]